MNIAKELDQRDQLILAALENNARIPISDLAKKVALSATAVRQRIARMEKDKVILGYTINTQKPNSATSIDALITLTLTGAFCTKLKQEFGHWPEIQKFWSLAGDLDSCLLISTSSLEKLSQLTHTLSDHELVTRVQTHIITTTHVDR
jgi:DNA-binding Lrp family transcriptional regulator